MVYVYYDGDQLFSGRCVDAISWEPFGDYYIAVAQPAETYLVSKLSEDDLFQVQCWQIDYREAFLRNPDKRWYVALESNWVYLFDDKYYLEEVSDELLPEAGCRAETIQE